MIGVGVVDLFEICLDVVGDGSRLWKYLGLTKKG